MIEQRLEQDGTGIYRRNGNKPIVDQLEDEMNKNIETMKSDHELMKGQGQYFYRISTYILPSPYFYVVIKSLEINSDLEKRRKECSIGAEKFFP